MYKRYVHRYSLPNYRYKINNLTCDQIMWLTQKKTTQIMFNIIYIYFLLNKMLINVYLFYVQKGSWVVGRIFINNFIQVFLYKKRKKISKLKHLYYDKMTTLSYIFFLYVWTLFSFQALFFNIYIYFLRRVLLVV